MFVRAFYVPTTRNVADALSRIHKRRSLLRFKETELQLLPMWFERAQRVFGLNSTMDWFASDDNAQLPHFCAWESASNAIYFDAFLHSWENDISYLFPPFCLIPRVLVKIHAEQAYRILVVPRGEGAGWWRAVLATKVGRFDISEPNPYRFPTRPGLTSKKSL